MTFKANKYQLQSLKKNKKKIVKLSEIHVHDSRYTEGGERNEYFDETEKIYDTIRINDILYLYRLSPNDVTTFKKELEDFVRDFYDDDLYEDDDLLEFATQFDDSLKNSSLLIENIHINKDDYLMGWNDCDESDDEFIDIGFKEKNKND